MQYKTKDGQEIKVGGVYSTEPNPDNKFKCYGFKSDGQFQPVFGLTTRKDGGEFAANYSENELLSLPESQPEYDPEQMWVVYISHDGKEIIEAARVTTYEYAQQRAKNSFPISAFAIAPVGKKFRKGDNL